MRQCLRWSDASIGGSGSVEWCAGLASTRSARRLPVASPCDYMRARINCFQPTVLEMTQDRDVITVENLYQVICDKYNTMHYIYMQQKLIASHLNLPHR